MAVAMDCEMVKSGNLDLLARVSIVDRQGSVLLDEYVKPTVTVTDYKTPWSGIRKQHLDNGKSFSDVKTLVSDLISGRILIGHSLQRDLDALKLPHPEVNRRDLAKYEPYMNMNKNQAKPQAQSLKILAQKYLNKHIQDGEHDSVIDAQTAMQLYNKVANNWN